MKKSISFITVLLLVSSLFTPAVVAGFSITQDTVVLQLTSDNAVDLATNTFLEDNPDAKVVKFGTFNSLLVLNAPINNLVVVGHGFEDGVLTHDGLKTWQEYANMIGGINANNAYLLNCQSGNVDEFLPNSGIEVHSFAGNIDARLGAMFASALINYEDRKFFTQTISDLFDLAEKIQNGVVDRVTLGFEGFEPVYYIVQVIVMLLAALISYGASQSAGAQAGAEAWAAIFATHHITVILALVAWWQGAMSDYQFGTELIGFIDEAAVAGSLVDHILDGLSWDDYVVWGVSLAATMATAVVSGSASLMLKVGTVTYLIADFIVGAIQDGQDCDGIIGQDPNVSCDGSGGGGGGGGGTFI